MQTIYLDVLILTNIFQDFLYLLFTKRILHHKGKTKRLILSSITGGISSLIILLPEINFIINIITNITISSILILLAFGFNNKKIFIRSTLTLYILSFLVNGALIFFYLSIKPNGMLIINDRVYFNISPILLILLTLLIYFILLIYKKLFSNHSNSKEIADVTIVLNNEVKTIKCKIDSGCNVKEPFSNSEVIIVERVMLKNFDLTNINKRIIPFDSLGGKGIIYGFKPEKVLINNKELLKEVYIGICDNILKGTIKGITPSSIFKDWLYDNNLAKKSIYKTICNR